MEKDLELCWKIKNFSCIPSYGNEFIQSPTFHGHDDFFLILRLFPRDEDDEYISLDVRVSGLSQYTIAKKSASVIASDGSILFTTNLKTYAKTPLCARSDIMENPNDLLPQDTLTLRCHLYLVKDPGLFIDTLELSKDLMSLFQSKEFFDLTLHVLDLEKRFYVHGFLIESAAPELCDYVNSREGESVAILDETTTSNTFNDFLKLLYGGFVGDTSLDDMSKLFDITRDLEVGWMKEDLRSLSSGSATTSVSCCTKSVDIETDHFIKCGTSREQLMCHFMIDLKFVSFIPVTRRKKKETDCIEIILRNISPIASNVFLRTKTSVFGVDGELEMSFVSEHWLKDVGAELTLPYVMTKQHLQQKNCVINDAVRFRFEVSASDGSVIHESHSLVPQTETLLTLNHYLRHRLLEQYLTLFTNKDGLGHRRHMSGLHDVYLTIDDQKVRVHRAMLSARSPVFAKMFRDENLRTNYTIDEMDWWTLDNFLRYIYTGSVYLDNRCESLYEAANRYQVQSLKNACSVYLSSNLSLGNVCDVVRLAKEHEDSQLLAAASKFVCEQWSVVKDSEDWEELKVENLPLVYEIIDPILSKAIS